MLNAPIIANNVFLQPVSLNIRTQGPQKEKEKKSKNNSAYQNNFRCPKINFDEEAYFFKFKKKSCKNHTAAGSFFRVHSSILFFLILQRPLGILFMPMLPRSRQKQSREKGPSRLHSWNLAGAAPRASNSPI